jgi:predicted site-specific integrase-resolvase
MSQIPISKAAEIVGLSLRTLKRHVTVGKLSVTHDMSHHVMVDTSELVRVYGISAMTTNRDKLGQVPRHVIPDVIPENDEISTLKSQLAVFKAQAEANQNLLDAKTAHIASLENAMRLLELKQPANQTPQIAKKRWWQF